MNNNNTIRLVVGGAIAIILLYIVWKIIRFLLPIAIIIVAAYIVYTLFKRNRGGFGKF